MSEKPTTNRIFANIHNAMAALPHIASEQKDDVYLQQVLYGPRAEIVPFLALQLSPDDENSVNIILDNWHNTGTEYVVRTASEMINLQSHFIAHHAYPVVKRAERVELKPKPVPVAESDIELSAEDIENGKKLISIWQVCESAYAEFHRQNIGYQFTRCDAAGKIEIFEKIKVFALFADDTEALNMLCENQHPEFKRIDKLGWKNGVLIPKKYYGRA